jgi:hypothetical protein
MKLRPRKLISALLLMSLISLPACKQQGPQPTGGSVSRSGGGDEAALAEAIVALLFLATKKAQDRGDCEQPLDKRSGTSYTRRRLLCDRLAQQDTIRHSSGPTAK